MSGVRDDRLAIWLAGLTTLTNFLFTLLGVWLVERVGRRKLTLGSIIGKWLKMSTTSSDVYRSYWLFFLKCIIPSTGTCLSLSLLAIGFLMSAQHSPPVTFHPTDPSMANSTCSKYQWVHLEFRWFQATRDLLLLEDHLLRYVMMTSAGKNCPGAKIDWFETWRYCQCCLPAQWQKEKGLQCLDIELFNIQVSSVAWYALVLYF